MNRCRKKRIILLEILIGLFLMALCSGLYYSAPVLFYKKNLELLVDLEKQLLADETYLKILSNLKENHSYKQLNSTPLYFDLGQEEIVLSNQITRRFHLGYTIWALTPKEGNNSTSFKHVKCQIHFYKDITDAPSHGSSTSRKYKYPFTYSIFVREAPSKKTLGFV